VDFAAYLPAIIAGYFLGSIPTGYLVARWRGVDIRTVGSGNIGATNVFRILGKGAGIFVLLADALKGVVAVLLASFVFAKSSAADARLGLELAAGISAILGHNYTCWLKFKGGKGIATTAGVLGALVPAALGILLVVWLVVFALSRYVSLASIIAAAALPVVVFLTTRSTLLTGITAAIGALAIYKHTANIQRLLAGTENRFGSGKKNPAPPAAPPASTTTSSASASASATHSPPK
jgi:glycerol-3-phosphate acyltransferase PlsY